MTAYIVISVLLCAAFVSFAFIRKRKNEKLKLLCVVDSSLALCGGVLCLVSYLLMHSALSSANGTFAEWLGDMAKVFYSIDIPVFAVLILAVFIPAFLSWADKKLRTGFSYAIRQAASVFAPAFMLILGGFYSVIVKNSTVPCDVYIRLMTLGQALVFRALYAVEYRSVLLSSSIVKKM